MFLIRVPSIVPAPWIKHSNQPSLPAFLVHLCGNDKSMLGPGGFCRGWGNRKDSEALEGCTRGSLLAHGSCCFSLVAKCPRLQCVFNLILDTKFSLLQEQDLFLGQQHRELCLTGQCTGTTLPLTFTLEYSYVRRSHRATGIPQTFSYPWPDVARESGVLASDNVNIHQSKEVGSHLNLQELF